MRIPYTEFATQQSQQQTQQTYQSSSNKSYMRYFSLKNDGDEAIIRFMYDSPEQFDILDIHSIKNGQYDTKYSCIRDPREPLDNCPLCKAGVPVQRRFYIKLLQYINDNGVIKVEPRVWERSTAYVSTLKSFMDEYSPLSDYIFKVKRVGKAGDKNTQYTIIPCNPSVYTSAVYKKDESLFANYEVLGSTVLEKNFEELLNLTPKKVDPQPNYQNASSWTNSSQQPPLAQPTQPTTVAQQSQAQQGYTPTRQYAPQQPEDMPWGNQQNQFTPTRRY